MSIFGKDARKKNCHDDEDEDKDDKSRVFYAALFRRPDFSDGLLFHGPFIGPKTGFYNFLGEPPNHEGDKEGGGNHKVPVAGDINGKVLISQKAFDGFVCQALQQRIRTSDHEICRKTSVRTGVAHDHPGHRMLFDAKINKGTQGRDNDGRGIRSNVPQGPDKGDEVRHESGRHAAHGSIQKGNQET